MDLQTEDYQQLLSSIYDLLEGDFKLGCELIKSQNINLDDIVEYTLDNWDDWYKYGHDFTVQYTIHKFLWNYNWDEYVKLRYHDAVPSVNKNGFRKTLKRILEFSIYE